jgi:hypothetical protein
VKLGSHWAGGSGGWRWGTLCVGLAYNDVEFFQRQWNPEMEKSLLEKSIRKKVF